MSALPLQAPMCAPCNPTLPSVLGTLTRPIQEQASWMGETSSCPGLSRRCPCENLPTSIILQVSSVIISFSSSPSLCSHTNNSGSEDANDPAIQYITPPIPPGAYRWHHYHFLSAILLGISLRQKERLCEFVHVYPPICRRITPVLTAQLGYSRLAESPLSLCSTQGTNSTLRKYTAGNKGLGRASRGLKELKVAAYVWQMQWQIHPLHAPRHFWTLQISPIPADVRLFLPESLHA